MANNEQMTPRELLEKLENDTYDASKTPENAGVKTGISVRTVLKRARDVGYVLIVLILIFILVSVLGARSRGQTPEVFGFRLYSIESGSMDPTLEIGSIILVRRPSDSSALEINDIITYRVTETAVVTHRIIDIILLEDQTVAYQTKGDNPMNSPDRNPVLPEQIEGVFILKVPLT
ncbi:MAG: signal peptidase I [Clostridiaceae bacterium]|nr:signal peptidase I [Clostridiaceae bacterium]